MFGRQLPHLLVLASLAAGPGCAPGGAPPQASYDDLTRRLVQLPGDLNGDARVDQWVYLDGNRPLRAEADTDGDGRVDRWEYFDRTGTLARVGTSSRNDGIEDTWSWAETEAGERRVEHSARRDGAIDRVETYRGDVLIRVAADTNGDGRPDAWQVFDEGRLREVQLDTRGRGRADRRLRYDGEGRFAGLEIDGDGDGVFETTGEGTRPR